MNENLLQENLELIQEEITSEDNEYLTRHVSNEEIKKADSI